MLGALCDSVDEREEVVGGALALAHRLGAARLVGLVQNDHSEAALQQKLGLSALLGAAVVVDAVHDEAGRDDADRVGAAGDVGRALTLDHAAVRVEPALLGGMPAGGGDRETILELDLPLFG